MPDVVLAVDIGSSWCKAAYLDGEGSVVAAGRAYTRDIHAARNGVPERFWQAFAAAVTEATSHLSAGVRPAAIGIACRSLYGICLDTAGRAHWAGWDYIRDRTAPEFQQAYSPQVWGDKDPFAYGYGTVLVSFLLWLRSTHPDEWQRIHRVGALHDYIVYRMTGEWTTDPTTGPGPDPWPDEIIALSGLSREAFPQVQNPQAVAGRLRSDAAAAMGLPAGIPVVVGLHDGAAANLGVGAIHAGDGCFTLGTNFVFRGVTGQRLTTRCFCYLVAPGSWAWVNNVPAASPQLDITAETLLPDGGDLAQRHAKLGKLAGEVTPGAGGLVVRLIRHGHEDELRRAVELASQAGHTRGEIYRAVLEAVAFGVRDLVNRAQNDGARPRRFVATGGSVQNAQFLQVLSAVLDTAIEAGHPEGGLVGAAIAAAVGTGWYATLDSAMAGMLSPASSVYPEPQAVAYYHEFGRANAT